MLLKVLFLLGFIAGFILLIIAHISSLGAVGEDETCGKFGCANIFGVIASVYTALEIFGTIFAISVLLTSVSCSRPWSSSIIWWSKLI